MSCARIASALPSVAAGSATIEELFGRVGVGLELVVAPARRVADAEVVAPVGGVGLRAERLVEFVAPDEAGDAARPARRGERGGKTEKEARGLHGAEGCLNWGARLGGGKRTWQAGVRRARRPCRRLASSAAGRRSRPRPAGPRQGSSGVGRSGCTIRLRSRATAEAPMSSCGTRIEARRRRACGGSRPSKPVTEQSSGTRIPRACKLLHQAVGLVVGGAHPGGHLVLADPVDTWSVIPSSLMCGPALWTLIAQSGRNCRPRENSAST